MAKNILTLDSVQALNYFLKSENYCTVEMPEYFNFSPLLDAIKKSIGDLPFEQCCASNPNEKEKINLEFLLNKDGKYGVRPLTIVNPYLYYFLCREVCAPQNWEAIKAHFLATTAPNIRSYALPLVIDETESFHNSTTILNWWNQIEQQSLELSLQYRYMFVTDITNCYGSINPEQIDSALSMTSCAAANDKNHQLAANIIKYIKAMQQGRNIGIPQGSAIFDLIGEIILSYADTLLHEKIQKQAEQLSDYVVIRYRDDYRIFCNNRDHLEKISYLLQEVLESLNFRMNTQKTRICNDLITSSIKPDKLAYIYNTPIFNKKGCDFDGIEKHLLYILLFARNYPNCGQLKNMLSDLDKRIEKKLKAPKRKWEAVDIIFDDDNPAPQKETPKEEIPDDKEKIVENKTAIIAIATQLAIENVTVVNYALRLVSRLLTDFADEQLRKTIIEQVYSKLRNLPNTTYSQLWLQNITYPYDAQNHITPYSLPLCQAVMGQKVNLWDNTWLKKELIKAPNRVKIVDKETLQKNNSIIIFRETRAYNELLEYISKIENGEDDEVIMVPDLGDIEDTVIATL